MTRGHVLAWRTQLEQRRLAGSTQRCKLAALASLYDYLLNANAISGGNPVHGAKRPAIETHEGKTPGLNDRQAKALLEALDADAQGQTRSHCISSFALSQPAS